MAGLNVIVGIAFFCIGCALSSIYILGKRVKRIEKYVGILV